MSEQRLIDANALINALNVFSDVVHGNKHFLTGIESAKELVVGFPTIDAVPVRRGWWEVAIGYDRNKRVQCQNCYLMTYDPTAYCPHCGAKMEDTHDSHQ